MSTTPVLLVHAFPLDGRMWRLQLDAIGTSRMVLNPDLRGFGRNRNAPFPLTIEQHARDMLDLLDRSGLPRAVVVGLSMGGYIALAMHRLSPERFAALMLCDTRAGADSPEGKRARTERIERIGREGIEFLPDEMVHTLVAPDCSTNIKLELRRIILEQNPLGVEAALVAMRDRPDATPYLRSIRVPCALVCGEHDVLTPPAVMQEMASHIPEASLTILPGAGHLSQLEAPEAFHRVLFGLLDRVP